MRTPPSRAPRLAALALLAAVAVTAPPVAAGSRGTSCSADRVRVWRITRTGSAPRDFDATVTYTGRGTRSTVTVVGADRRGAGWLPFKGYTYVETGGQDAYPYVYGGTTVPVATPARPDVAACDDGSGRLSFPVRRRNSTQEWFVAALTTDVTITMNSPGWTVSELARNSGANLRILRTEDGTGLGSEVHHQGLEHFTGVAADGGGHGSVAWAHLPCEDARAWVPAPSRYMTGWGAATLLGGDSTPMGILDDRYLKCDGYDTTGIGQASGPTRWVLRGEAVGLAVGLNRLTVFDFPKPEAGAANKAVRYTGDTEKT